MSCCDTQEQLAGFVECRQHFHLPFISTKCYYKKNIYMWLRLSAIGKGSHLLLNLNLSFLCTMWLYIAISSLSLLSYYILGMYLPFPLISCVTSSTVVYIYIYACLFMHRCMQKSGVFFPFNLSSQNSSSLSGKASISKPRVVLRWKTGNTASSVRTLREKRSKGWGQRELLSFQY